MTNLCSNTVTFTNSKERIDELEHLLNSENDDFLNYYLPIPEDCKNELVWCIDNWGTKWDVYIQNWERLSPESMELSFDSAWEPPIKFYEFMYNNGWSIEAYYSEDVINFMGKFSDGEDNNYAYDLDVPTSYRNIPQDVLDYAGLEL
jgi:hypothetical protein